MKGIMKKNQIIITSLAILIAIAGYLNYTEKDVKKQSVSNGVESVNDGTNDKDEYIFTDEEPNEDTSDKSENSNQSGDTDVNGTKNSTNESVEPGEAVFTNAGTFSANAKLSREQIRAQNKEALMNMLNSANLSEEQKNNITNEMISMTENAELENDIETLLGAKGYTDAVVSVDGDKVDVVLNMTDVSDSSRAAIEDIIKRKAGVEAKNIVITPLSDIS